ncbi:MAG: glyoxylase-like metal-dependent hydrolase (beta-lactamase superfamily II), partial [Saprospiraceae bacterium]
PGHAVHHIAWRIGDDLIAGDVAGCTIERGPVVPPCPPPDINLEDWEASIDLILNSGVKAMYLTHFGKVTEIEKHLEELRTILWDWAKFIKPYFDKGTDPKELTPIFAAYAEQQLRDAGVEDDLAAKYDKANPAWMSVAGLMRYWGKKA